MNNTSSLNDMTQRQFLVENEEAIDFQEASRDGVDDFPERILQHKTVQIDPSNQNVMNNSEAGSAINDYRLYQQEVVVADFIYAPFSPHENNQHQLSSQ